MFEENVRQFLSNPLNWIFACVQDNKIIGFAYGYKLNHLDNNGNMLYIHEAAIPPQYQRQGIGFQIINGIKNA
ncbi:GNAT family N-acetyltransferase [Tepidimicrobium xylanilyticum]|uniref:GNAT family N-acetyltransferase n=1 Tax=Tepidimicrobium xylanilyticum TaxID=1123352 RepID=UPI000B84529B